MATEPQSETSLEQRYQGFVDRVTTQVIAAMPLTVRDEDLKRARARFRVAFSSNAQGSLVQCTPESIGRAIVMSAMSGLYPGGPRPDVWLIPRKNRHKGNQVECNWQMSYRGYIRLARRAGWELEPVLVFDGEEFEVVEGSNPTIVHKRRLEIEPSWEGLRYGYIRAYPVGHREQARFAYLTKAEIVKRRGKAQDQNIWNEWPLEMAYKTLCSYAGNRELFPTDDPMRYAMEESEQSEIGGNVTTVELMPGQSKTAALVERITAPQRAAEEEPQLEAPEEVPVIERELPPSAQQAKEFFQAADEFMKAPYPDPAYVEAFGGGGYLTPAELDAWVKDCTLNGLTGGALEQAVEDETGEDQAGKDPDPLSWSLTRPQAAAILNSALQKEGEV
jgi:recombinational DNA repair protein RecT